MVDSINCWISTNRSLWRLQDFFCILLVQEECIKSNSFSEFCFAGYYCVDQNSTAEKVVFNRTVTLRDSYKPTKPAGK